MTGHTGGAAPATTSEAARELPSGVREWMTQGGCQGDSGAFHAWRDAETGELAFAYPEITGYALTFLCAPERPSQPELEAAARAGDWLVERLDTRGDLSARDGWDDGSVYNFDLAMIAAGLLNAAGPLDDPRLEALGIGLVESMAGQVDDRGRVPALGPGSHTSREGWSVDGEAHMLKALQCFALAERAGSKPAREVIEAMAASAPGVQDDDGRFVTQAVDDRTMLHPHLYAVEGLWSYAQAKGDDEARERAEAGARWAAEQQLPSGGFPRFAPAGSQPTDERPPEQFDLTSQALRAACLFDVDPEGRARCAERLASVASPSEFGGLALPYQPEPAPVHHNAWVSMFAAQAVALESEGRQLGWEELV